MWEYVYIIRIMPRAEDYSHFPTYHEVLRWRARVDDPDYRTTPHYGREFSLSYTIAIHPNRSGRIIINYPGYRGDIDGFEGKHRKLAQYMQGENLGAVVRGKGPGHPDLAGFTIDLPLRSMIDFSLENASRIAGTRNPELLLIGTSAGAGAVASVAHEYESVSRMLLMAPGDNMGGEAIRKGLQRFAGEVFIVIGQNDESVGVEAGRTFLRLATGARKKELFEIPNCNHKFRGEQNGRYMSQAPFYAFARDERPKFPDPEGGMVLY